MTLGVTDSIPLLCSLNRKLTAANVCWSCSPRLLVPKPRGVTEQACVLREAILSFSEGEMCSCRFARDVFPLTSCEPQCFLHSTLFHGGQQSETWQHSRPSYGRVYIGKRLRSKEFRVKWPLACFSPTSAHMKGGSRNQKSEDR